MADPIQSPALKAAPATAIANEAAPATAGFAPKKRPHKLTRADMEKTIADGGSVMHDGQIHTTADTLPSEVDLAEGDTERERAAADAIDAQIATLQAERGRLAVLSGRNAAKFADKPKA